MRGIAALFGCLEAGLFVVDAEIVRSFKEKE